MEYYIIAVDPGKAGGLAVIDKCSEELKQYTYFDIERYREAFRIYKPATLYIEQVHAMPRDSRKGAFNFGTNYGFIKGMAYANNCKIVEVSPQKWKHYYGLDGDKKKSIHKAYKLYQHIDLNIGKRKRIESDGMAEAILIARYGLEAENE